MIHYVTECDPSEHGVYACRVPLEWAPGFFDDIFLIWSNGSWYYPRSDQSYRGEVTGWIGPLQRRMR